MTRIKIVIMGAAGRDFHNFNCLFRNNPEFEVVAFTATQIPNIDGRRYPAELAGAMYPHGIPIVPEEDLEAVIRANGVKEVWFSYSDISHSEVMRAASRVASSGAHFKLAAAESTMLRSNLPVISICAVRTGVGKSQTTRYLSRLLKREGLRVVAIRHPMPYGDLAAQACQRFADYADLDRHQCTIEEREEYEPHIDNGFVVYAGVDYQKILREAEREADVILWDGGNNDTSFFFPDLSVVLLDPHRAGDELDYYPGMVNLLSADLLLINKIDTAEESEIEKLESTIARWNSHATVVRCASHITLDEPSLVAGRRALVVEDGPTLTHGGMKYGAGWFAAKNAGASEIVDARPYAVGSLKETYEKYPNAAAILPAMGYGKEQVSELEATINATPADVVVEGTPIDLSRILHPNKPIANVRYELEPEAPGVIAQCVMNVLKKAKQKG